MIIRPAFIVTILSLCTFLPGFLFADEDYPTLAIGAPAPDFRLPGVDGREYSLSDFQQAKVLAVIFTCNHCPTAQAYEERIKQLVTDFKDKGVAFVAISPNDPKAVRLDELGWSDMSDSFEEMKLRAEHKQFNFPYLYDGDTQEVSKAYGPKATPHVFIFDEARRLRYVGRVDENERRPDQVKSPDARNAIEALLAGKPVPVEHTRTFGCSVKWADKRSSVDEAFAKWAQEPVTIKVADSAQVKQLLENRSDKLRLVNVWATWCGPCRVEFPDLVTINRMYRHREFELITISADDLQDKEKALAFLKEQQASTTNLIFAESGYKLFDVLDDFAGGKMSSGALPYTMLIAPGGKVIYRKEGRIDPLVVKREIIKVMGNTYR
ncbi:MAG TPA: redoxin family protein [Acidobacteriota bacterium]|nr:redoxin family protein [Acidobacteriota bacterium]